ncbi:hypothetical protein FKM82_009481 [Ascaphus truei]
MVGTAAFIPPSYTAEKLCSVHPFPVIESCRTLLHQHSTPDSSTVHVMCSIAPLWQTDLQSIAPLIPSLLDEPLVAKCSIPEPCRAAFC